MHMITMITLEIEVSSNKFNVSQISLKHTALPIVLHHRYNLNA